jgi:hypothetical protein
MVSMPQKFFSCDREPALLLPPDLFAIGGPPII